MILQRDKMNCGFQEPSSGGIAKTDINFQLQDVFSNILMIKLVVSYRVLPVNLSDNYIFSDIFFSSSHSSVRITREVTRRLRPFSLVLQG